MEWFYSAGSERKGPVSESELSALIASGAITPETLVWKKDFPEWKKAAAAGLFSGPPPLDHHRCIITGKTFPSSQMIQTEHGWVSAEGRDTYYQCLREGVPFPSVGGVFNARADGKRIVIPVADSRMPPRCVITNLPVTSVEIQRKKLYWCPPLVYLALLASVLIVIILYYVFRKPVSFDLALSADGKRAVTRRQLTAGGIVVGGIALIAVGVALSGQTAALTVILGVFVLLFGLVYAAVKGSALRVVKLKNGEAWLAGAGPEFLASLPPYVK